MMDPIQESGKSACRATLELYGLEFCMIVKERPYGDANKVGQEDSNMIR